MAECCPFMQFQTGRKHEQQHSLSEGVNINKTSSSSLDFLPVVFHHHIFNSLLSQTGLEKMTKKKYAYQFT